jgi:oligopeptidase B
MGKDITAPKAEKIRKELVKHNNIRIDNYFWLNEKENPKVIEYLKAENNYLNKKLKHTENLQEKIYNEIIGRIKQEDKSVPYLDNGYYYFHVFKGNKEYPVYCRQKNLCDEPEEIILDVNGIAKDNNFLNVTGLNVSPDNKILAFGVDTLGRREYTIYFKDLNTGKIIPDKIEYTTGNPIWANESKTVFYSKKDNTLRPFKIFRHKLGSEKDEEVYHEKDETFGVYISKTKSKKYILIESYSTLSTEFRFLDADKPDESFKIIQPREKNLEYYVGHHKDNFFINTNLNAKNFRLVKAPVENPSKENWIEIIPHRSNVLLEGMDTFKNFLVIQERKDGIKFLRIINWIDNSDYNLEFEEENYSLNVQTNPEFNSDKLRFVYNSFTVPGSTYDYDMNQKKKTLLKREEVLGDFNSHNYISERLYAVSHDGAKIPVSIVYKKGLKKDGQNPLLLYGYGSYGICNDPNFNSIRISLLDRGIIFGIAHVRGGQEMGRDWYENGKLLKKKNTFIDFIHSAEMLINKNYTSPEKLFAIGVSAGGLLMGTIANMRPDLFRGIIANVPFVDVLTTMLDEKIPLTTFEYDEWGNPNLKEFYEYILSYSPYDNIESKKYPAMLISTALFDSQVQYWEPAKWVAKLREMKKDDNLLLLYTNFAAGHSGASGRFERYKLNALEYAFILDQLNTKD